MPLQVEQSNRADKHETRTQRSDVMNMIHGKMATIDIIQWCLHTARAQRSFIARRYIFSTPPKEEEKENFLALISNRCCLENKLVGGLIGSTARLLQVTLSYLFLAHTHTH